MKAFRVLEGKRKLVMGAIALAASALVCVFAVVVWYSITDGAAAWFSNNKKTEGNTAIESIDENLLFGDTITVNRYLGNQLSASSVYRRDETDKQYYLYQNGAYVEEDGERIGLLISGIFPGEAVDFILTVNATGPVGKSLNYAITLNHFDDTVGGTFALPAGNDTFGPHSVMGIYAVSYQKSDDVTYTDATDKWLATYHLSEHAFIAKDTYPGGAGTAADAIAQVCTGTLVAGSSDTLTLRLTLDLSQYVQIQGTVSNLLSEKTFSIGAIRLSGAQGGADE